MVDQLSRSDSFRSVCNSPNPPSAGDINRGRLLLMEYNDRTGINERNNRLRNALAVNGEADNLPRQVCANSEMRQRPKRKFECPFYKQSCLGNDAGQSNFLDGWIRRHLDLPPSDAVKATLSENDSLIGGSQNIKQRSLNAKELQAVVALEQQFRASKSDAYHAAMLAYILLPKLKNWPKDKCISEYFRFDSKQGVKGVVHAHRRGSTYFTDDPKNHEKGIFKVIGAENHAWPVIKGKLKIVGSMGDCIYHAILLGMSEQEQRTLLGNKYTEYDRTSFYDDYINPNGAALRNLVADYVRDHREEIIHILNTHPRANCSLDKIINQKIKYFDLYESLAKNLTAAATEGVRNKELTNLINLEKQPGDSKESLADLLNLALKPGDAIEPLAKLIKLVAEKGYPAVTLEELLKVELEPGDSTVVYAKLGKLNERPGEESFIVPGKGFLYELYKKQQATALAEDLIAATTDVSNEKLANLIESEQRSYYLREGVERIAKMCEAPDAIKKELTGLIELAADEPGDAIEPLAKLIALISGIGISNKNLTEHLIEAVEPDDSTAVLAKLQKLNEQPKESAATGSR